jgi:hypothetical protein
LSCSRDENRLAASRIVRHPRVALSRGECAESAELDPTIRYKLSYDRFEKKIYDRPYGSLRQVWVRLQQ